MSTDPTPTAEERVKEVAAGAPVLKFDQPPADGDDLYAAMKGLIHSVQQRHRRRYDIDDDYEYCVCCEAAWPCQDWAASEEARVVMGKFDQPPAVDDDTHREVVKEIISEVKATYRNESKPLLDQQTWEAKWIDVVSAILRTHYGPLFERVRELDAERDALRAENERLRAVVAGRDRALEGKVEGDFDALCARVSAHDYWALDLEFLVGFSQGSFDRMSALQAELKHTEEELVGRSKALAHRSKECDKAKRDLADAKAEVERLKRREHHLETWRGEDAECEVSLRSDLADARRRLEEMREVSQDRSLTLQEVSDALDRILTTSPEAGEGDG